MNRRFPEPCLCGDPECPRCFAQPMDDDYEPGEEDTEERSRIRQEEELHSPEGKRRKSEGLA